MSTRSPAQVSVSSNNAAPIQAGGLQRSQVYLVQAKQDQELQADQVEQSAWTATGDRHNSSFKHNFSQIPVRSSSPIIQPKLVIGQPNDRYEQEADRVADQVMRMPESGMGRSIQPLGSTQNNSLQRQVESSKDDDEEELVQAKALPHLLIHSFNPQPENTLQRQTEEDSDDDETIQTKPAPGQQSSAPTSLQTQLHASQHGGQPLPAPTRRSMESRFNYDFSGVRVHTDRSAAQLNQQIHAQAFTHQQHIYFGQGYYQPTTPTGQHLLAHELTHVVQQTGGWKVQPTSLVQLRSSQPHLQARRTPNSVTISPKTESTIQSPDAGVPMPNQVQQQIESQVGADLSSVRVHTGERASQAATSLRARAFTYGNHIFLNRGESRHDIGLMAHESVHVVQQQPALAYAHAGLLTAPPQVQRIIPDYVLENLDDYARYIPGYTLFTVIVGYNPLRLAPVERTPINLVQGLMELVPFGTDIFNKLQGLGILQQAFDWIKQELARFDLSLARLERLLDEAYEEMDFIRLDPIDYNTAVLERKFGGLLNDVKAFANSLVNQIIQLIKDAAIGVAEGLLAENQAWALLKKILHYDPLRGVEVSSTTVEILEGFLLLIGKQQELEQMRERGTLEETAAWLDTQFAMFTSLLAELIGIFTAAWETIQPANLPNLGTNLEVLANRVVGFLTQVWQFATTVAVKVLELIKQALLGWLSSFAHEIPGFHLLTVIIGRNPFTDEEVPLTPTNLIRGFMSLIPGGEQQFEQMQETGVIPEAAQRIESAMSELGISWEFVQGLFLNIWNAFTIEDLLQPIDAFTRILDQFREPLNRLFTFVIEVVKVILELVLVLMHFPTDLIGNIIANALQALDDIQRDPVGFLINLLETMKLGFSNFFNNILEHLIGGLANWLFSEVREAGIEPPTDLTFESILGFVLDILGLSMEHLWELLANHVGQERVAQIRGAIDRLTGAWNFIQDVQERGIVAVWEYIESQLSNLWDMVLAQVQNWVMERIVNVGMRWLMSLLDVTGITPVINSFIAVFNAIESAIEYLNEMLAVINDFVSTVASIARGDIQPGAERMELGLSNSLPIVIGFLANQFGLDNIGERLQEIIAGARELIDAGLNWLIEQALRLGQAVLRSLGFGGEGDGEDSQTPPEVQSRHEAILRELIPRLEEDNLSPTLDDAQWLAGKRQQAEQLEREIQPRLEEGVHLHVAVEQGAIPRQLIYNMDIAPNTVGVSGSTAPPTLTKGELYTFFVDKRGNSNPVTGKFLETAIINGQQIIWYDSGEARETEYRMSRTGRPLGHSPVRTWVPALQPNGTPNYRLASAGGGEAPVFRSVATRSTANGIQALEVEAEPLALTTTYSAPRETPPGLSRIKMNLLQSGAWVPGHLVNGSMGGPGTNENMVPIPRGINARMRGNYENTLRSNLQAGRYYYFHAKVDYHPAIASTTIGRTTDFAKTISINYQEIQKTGSTWARIGANTKLPNYTVDLPDLSELDPARVSG